MMEENIKTVVILLLMSAIDSNNRQSAPTFCTGKKCLELETLELHISHKLSGAHCAVITLPAKKRLQCSLKQSSDRPPEVGRPTVLELKPTCPEGSVAKVSAYNPIA